MTLRPANPTFNDYHRSIFAGLNGDSHDQSAP